MSIKFRVLGGGGECQFYFYGREDFSDTCSDSIAKLSRACFPGVFATVGLSGY